MPRTGENLLQRFVSGIVNGEAWAFGKPSMSDGASAIVLPILRERSRTRRYRLAEEVAEDVRGEDLGRIDRIRVRNDTGGRVFLRPGALFRGRETQSRGTSAGVLVNPQSHANVDVCCVHASCPVVEGATLEFSRETAPDPVLEALLLRDQGLVWTSISEAVGAARGPTTVRTATPSISAGSDDLLGALADVFPVEDTADELQAEPPDAEKRCGIFVLDARGVIAVEVFDSPDSWKVVAPAVLRRYAHLLRPDPTSPMRARVDAETAVRLAKEFLNELPPAADRRRAGQGRVPGSPVAEYAALDGEVIHLLAFRPARSKDIRSRPASDLEGEAVPAGTVGFPFSGLPAPVPQPTEGMASGDGETAVAGAVAVDLEEDWEPSPPPVRVRRRKVLTSGWDPRTFQALEHYSHKEFQGDRSRAVRFLVRNGLGRRGYLGPQPSRETSPSPIAATEAQGSQGSELERASEEDRVRDLERIALTDHYAGWLRERAHVELERIASAAEDEPLRAAARSALDRIPPTPAAEEIEEPASIEAPPTPPPVDVTELLRRAITASAAGNYVQAIAEFDEALEADPVNTTALLGRAVAFRRAGKKPEALAGLDLVLRLEPRNAAALLNRGRLLRERGDLKDSLETFDRLVEAAPNDWDVWMERGDVLLEMGRDEDALRSYSEALRRNPDDEELQRRTRALERLRTAPSAGGTRRVTLPPGVEEGQSYLAKERRPDLSYRVFTALAAQNVPALLITRQPLERVRREPGLGGVRILGLGHKPGMDVYSPTALAPLSRAVERFVEENHGRGVLLLDGLETLVSGSGFRNTLLFVEHVNELVVQRRAIFLISVTPEGLPEKEMALLERNLRIIS